MFMAMHAATNDIDRIRATASGQQQRPTDAYFQPGYGRLPGDPSQPPGGSGQGQGSSEGPFSSRFPTPQLPAAAPNQDPLDASGAGAPAVAIGTGAAGALDYMQPVIFSGEVPKPQGEMGIKDFIRAIENRQKRHNYTSAQTVQHALSCLRGEAHDWFERIVQYHITPDQLKIVLANWESFRALIISEYDYNNEMLLVVGNRSALRPKESTESDMQFLKRISEAHGVIRAQHLREADFNDPNQYQPPRFLLESASQYDLDQNRRICAAHGYAMGIERAIDLILAQILMEGLEDKKLREWVYKFKGRVSWFNLHNGVKGEVRRLKEIKNPQGTKPSEDKGPRSFRALAAAVDSAVIDAIDNDDDPIEAAKAELAEDWDEHFEALAEAIATRRKAFLRTKPFNQYMRGMKKRHLGNGQPSPTSSLPPLPAMFTKGRKPSPAQRGKTARPSTGRPFCSYCKKQGHIESTCFQKIAADSSRNNASANAIQLDSDAHF